jgi:hypothetical protein
MTAVLAVGYMPGQWEITGKLPEENTMLLKKVVSVRVNGRAKFMARQENRRLINFSSNNEDFDQEFLDMVEENVEGVNIVIHNLQSDSKITPILTELGERAEIKLAHFFGLLATQLEEEQGKLLVNACISAVIKNNGGDLEFVTARWDSRDSYWRFSSLYVIDKPYRRSLGSRVSCATGVHVLQANGNLILSRD